MKEQIVQAIVGAEERIALLRLLQWNRERALVEHSRRAAEAYDGIQRAKAEIEQLGRLLAGLRKHLDG